MAKKIRFPLKMKNEVEVRNLEELRNNFSILKVVMYLNDGKLITWLRDRYLNDIADAVETLDVNDTNIAGKLCELFDIPFDDKVKNELESIEEKEERLVKLKEYTDDKRYEVVIDSIAFNQDELYDLLDEKVNKIYLCGEKFYIPLSQKGITYIGINNPIVIIESKEEVNWNIKEIVLENITFDEKYEKIINESRKQNEIKEKEDTILQNNLEKIIFFREKVNEKKVFTMKYPSHRFESNYFYEGSINSKGIAEKKAHHVINNDIKFVESLLSDTEGKIFLELGNKYWDDLESICKLCQEIVSNNFFDTSKILQGYQDIFTQLYNDCSQLYNTVDWYNIGTYWVEEEYTGGGLFSKKTYRVQMEYKIEQKFRNIIKKSEKMFSDRYLEYKKSVFDFSEYDFEINSKAESENASSKEIVKPLNKDCSPGDKVLFGRWYTKSSTLKDDLCWKVLSVENSKSLLITNYAIDVAGFDESSSEWNTSSIKEWLNSSFKTSAFNDNESNLITSDIFLLSEDEANKYFKNDYERRVKSTEFAISKGAFIDEDGNSNWWLRTPYGPQKICYVTHKGKTGCCTSVRSDGVIKILYDDDQNGTIRPALWVQL